MDNFTQLSNLAKPRTLAAAYPISIIDKIGISRPAINPLLGVNIDHIATLRQARGGVSRSCGRCVNFIQAGRDGITLHLREDRRHIQDDDVYRFAKVAATRMNLEMAVTDEMIAIACDVKPAWVCAGPEKRQELTTEGGLDVIGNQYKIAVRFNSYIKSGPGRHYSLIQSWHKFDKVLRRGQMPLNSAAPIC